MRIREYTKNDIDELVHLWIEVFEDGEEFVQGFFELLPKMGTCVIGEENGIIVAMTSILTEMNLVSKENTVRTGYIYAVAVKEKFRKRGFGIEISKAAYNKAMEMGVPIVTTMPASDSLYKFYSDTLHMSTSLYRKKFGVPAQKGEKVESVNAQAYEKEREKYLQGQTHLCIPTDTMKFLEILCKEYGGGLFMTDSGICCAQCENDTCIIYEMLSSDPARTASSVASSLGMEMAEYYLPSTDGEKFIMSAGNEMIPKETIYNVAFE